MKHGIGTDNESFQRDDKYLEDVLSYRNAISEKHKMHLHVIAHPNKTEKDTGGKRLAPTPFDYKGGQEWFNNGKCMITLHRTDGTSNEVKVIVNKAKPKSVASLGESIFYLDVSKNRYYTDGVNGKRYAEPIYKKPKALLIADKESQEDDGLPF
jgi:hypothetical protein